MATRAGSATSATWPTVSSPALRSFVAGAGSDAPEPLDRERVEELELLAGWDAEEPVRLGDAARHLGEELRARDSHRHGDAHALAHISAQALGDLDGRARDPAHPADVQECLVDGEALDERRRVLEDLVERFARLRVSGHARRHDDGVGAKASCLGAAHRGPHAVCLRLVARRENHASAYDHGAAAEARVVPLLDRCEERIRIGMEDCRLAPHEHMFA